MHQISPTTLKPYAKAYIEGLPLFMSLIRTQEAALFRHFEKYISGNILDFGSGDGFFANLVFGKGVIDIGLDVPHSRVKDAEAKKVYKKYVLYDGNVIPFADNEFSTVISNCVLEHLPHLSTNLNEISRVLKKKGYFLTSVMTDKWEKYMFGSSVAGNWYRQFMRTKQDHVNLLSADGWREQFQRAGFQVVEEIGYVSPSNARYLDIFHYLSFPSLVSYKLFNKWVPFPQLNNLLKLENLITSLMEVPTEIDKSSAVFYVLEKK